MVSKCLEIVDWLKSWFYDKNEVDTIINGLSNKIGTFEELQRLIDLAPSDAVIELEKDYKNINHYVARSTPAKSGLYVYTGITIDGKGHTIDGDNFEGILNISVSGSTTIEIKNCVIKNSIGGAIVNLGGTLKLTNCTFENNRIVMDDNHTRPVSPVYSNLTYSDRVNTVVIDNCKFLFNDGENYSCIEVYGDSTENATITNCTFFGHTKPPFAVSGGITLTQSNNTDFDEGTYDTAWKEVSYNSGYKAYGTNNGLYYRRKGRTIELSGAWTTSAPRTASNEVVTFASIPAAYAPSRVVRVRCQGSGLNTYVFTVNTNGTLGWSRYGTTSSINLPATVWGTVDVTWTK